MCGICGQLNFATGERVESTTIRRMTQAIAHRGPDDEGYFVRDSIGLGFRRLSIIDLAGGHQPMFDEEQTVCVIFNGEIYNYKELRYELQQSGYQFRIASMNHPREIPFRVRRAFSGFDVLLQADEVVGPAGRHERVAFVRFGEPAMLRTTAPCPFRSRQSART